MSKYTKNQYGFIAQELEKATVKSLNREVTPTEKDFINSVGFVLSSLYQSLNYINTTDYKRAVENIEQLKKERQTELKTKLKKLLSEME